MILSLERKYAQKVIQNCTIQNDSIINIHRINTQNSGDLKSAPYLYFNELNQYQKLDILNYQSYNFLNTISWTKKVTKNDIILGGGGLLDRPSFSHSIEMMNLLVKKGRKVALWGVGHNNPSYKVSQLFYKQIQNFKLVGLRDYQIKGTEWVPCVSCMNSIFDQNFDTKQDIGIIEHEHIKLSGNQLNGFPRIQNNSSFEQIISFIGSVEMLITNSYHAMYWAMLMKKKVVVIPNSSKMFSFKYKVPTSDDGADALRLLKKAPVYDELLDECRQINNKFSEKVFDYMNI
ncbi:polysaccharide pyruvyl transferase family protein [Sunxiuqinia sp. A32]|uniref:polysaccharide pyruvyl transferase family protein n=1 Tax=Sunxiuqinia sp. A32 TaxID=3461496 RepID=UPI0040468326